MFIYLVGNRINLKVYIGQTSNYVKRWKGHRRDAQRYHHPFHNSIRKYGIDNFEFVVLEKCIDSVVDDREIYWISYFDSTNRDRGYNIQPGGQSGGFHGDKIAKSLSKQTLSEEHKAKISASLRGHIGSWRGKKFPIEMREKLSRSRCKYSREEAQKILNDFNLSGKKIKTFAREIRLNLGILKMIIRGKYGSLRYLNSE